VGLTGLPEEKRAQAIEGFPGRDFSSLLTNADSASVHQVRKGVLYNYLGLGTVDAEYLKTVMESQMLDSTKQPPIAKAGMTKRGLVSFAFDGRYKFGRFYAPTAFNTPTTLEEILKNNDAQLFDLHTDPHEVHNLVLAPEKHRETILRMNQLLNDLIASEVGVNDGAFLKPLLDGGSLAPGGA
jgi:arylsulfatase